MVKRISAVYRYVAQNALYRSAGPVSQTGHVKYLISQQHNLGQYLEGARMGCQSELCYKNRFLLP